MTLSIVLLAMLIEAVAGYPDWLVRFLGHPVIWIGRLIGILDRALNRETWGDIARRNAGGLTLLIIIVIPAGIAYGLAQALSMLPFGQWGLALIASTLIAQHSLHAHVRHVATALERSGIVAGREAVAHIVGRDPQMLDEAGVVRAAIESLAENFSDGIVAPVIWMIVGGLTGGVVYKAVNTADSMIGHRTPRYWMFGFAAARLDDLLNLPASRLSALLIVAVAAITPHADAAGAWRAVIRDAPRHRSPNAGYPEAAMAGALGLALAGPRSYSGVAIDDAIMGQGGRREAKVDDIHQALRLYRRADALLIGFIAAMALFLIAIA